MDSSVNSTICGICNSITDDGELAICCEGHCGKWFHCACVSLSNDQFNMFTALEDNAVWLCPIDKLEFNKWKILYKVPNLQSSDTLNQTFKETSCPAGSMDAIIDKLDEIREGLKSIDELKSLVVECNVKIDTSITSSSLLGIRNKTTSKRRSIKSHNSAILKPVIKPVTAENSLVPTDHDNQRLISSEIINLVDLPVVDAPCSTEPLLGCSTTDRPTFAAVLSRSPSPVVNGTDPVGGSLLRVVLPPKVIFLSRLQYGTTPSEILDYIEAAGIDPTLLQCYGLTPSNDPSRIIASFKLIVPEALLSRLLDVNFWPANLIVKEFSSRPRKSAASKNSTSSRSTTRTSVV